MVKEEKTYESWPNATTKVLQKRKDDKGSILRSTPVPKDHPKKIAASIALTRIPKASDLVEKSLSWF